MFNKHKNKTVFEEARDAMIKKNTPSKWGWLVVAACCVSDWLCVYTYAQYLYNETAVVSWIVSGVLCLGLDVSLYYAGMVMSKWPSSAGDRRMQRRVVIAMVVVFLCSYGVFVLTARDFLLLSQQSLWGSGTLPRLILPVVTSILSFYIGFSWSKEGSRKSELQACLEHINVTIDELTRDINRMSAQRMLLDPDTYDAEAYCLARERVSIEYRAACARTRTIFAQALNSPEAADKLLGQIDFEPDEDVKTLFSALAQPGLDLSGGAGQPASDSGHGESLPSGEGVLPPLPGEASSDAVSV